jgi:hypothetical protein
MTGCASKPVPISFELPLGGFLKSHRPVSSQASLLGPWALSGMTLLAVGYHAKVVALGCMAKRKGVSSRANLLISVKVLVGNVIHQSCTKMDF